MKRFNPRSATNGRFIGMREEPHGLYVKYEDVYGTDVLGILLYIALFVLGTSIGIAVSGWFAMLIDSIIGAISSWQ